MDNRSKILGRRPPSSWTIEWNGAQVGLSYVTPNPVQGTFEVACPPR